MRAAGTTAADVTQKLNLSPALLDPEVLSRQFKIIKLAQDLAVDVLEDADLPKLDRLKVAAQFIPKMSAEIVGKLADVVTDAMKKQAPQRRSPATNALLKQSKEVLGQDPEPEDTA